ncbi:GGDEF domain-containing protein [Marinospirillum alkaliphilum]|uniref:diguanylate cyclase n=1 Tax=Marinospirillum alkaliphilum DSM 21637 TaxID=1122209 RepID=A0A1K1U2V1_9GAMM|nr:sensor domain-containing diguanylate cyclase [Marinospirillum alkaliphilum]SFX07114.1 diguanylate cyclase (GGDEF) domain-containing protein [Marinospirillum alkaliphilum DSM 21637]
MTAQEKQPDLTDFYWMIQMLQTVDVGLVILGRDYRIQLWNGFMENHSGLPGKQITGQDIFSLLPDLPRTWMERKIESVFKLGAPAYSTWEQRPHLFRFKSYRPLTGQSELMYQNITFMPLLGPDRKVQQVCLLIYDVTESATSKLQLEQANQQLEKLSRTDRLTGLNNRGFWEECLQQEYRRCKRSGGHASLIIFDIDHFKAVNDTHGHQAGDEVIRQVAKQLKHTARDTDLAGRYGGEEFVLLLPDTDEFGALEVAERLRHLIQDMTVDYEQLKLKITISLGVCPYSNELQTARQWLEQADQALYHSKHQGRNQTSLWRPDLTQLA